MATHGSVGEFDPAKEDWSTVFHTKTLEKSFLDDLLIFSELHDPMHICMYHHEGLSFGS